VTATEPHIQYCKASDGVSIAYAVAGEGPPVAFVTGIFGDLHMASYGATANSLTEHLIAGGWRVIRYDQRGTGSSDRDCKEFSLDGGVSDLEAVIDSASPAEPCALVGMVTGGPVAIAYAARHPTRVSSLVLRNAYANGADPDHALLAMVVARALRPVLPEHWEFYTLTLAHAMEGYKGGERTSRIGEGLRTAMPPQTYLAIWEAWDKVDVSRELESVAVPTLVVNDTSYMTFGEGWGPISRRLASRIPNARMVVTDDFVKGLMEFLRQHAPVSRMKPSDGPSGTAVILFADIADSTALTERIGDKVFRERGRVLDEALRKEIASHGGTAIDGRLLGDGVLATFSSAPEAIATALACGVTGDGHSLPLHLGLHAGDVIRDQDNVFGGAVNIASRISGLSAPGEVLVSDIVRGLARTSAGVTFEDRGEHALKGIPDPVRLFAVCKSPPPPSEPRNAQA
jgi:class 3 adenylate cyclase